MTLSPNTSCATPLGAPDDGAQGLFFARMAPTPSTALCDAALAGDAARIDRLLLEGADANEANADGFTPLMIAAAEGHRSCIETLLPCSDTRLVDPRWHQNALMQAAYCSWGTAAACLGLLATAINPNARDRTGRTALHIAVSQRIFDACEFLIPVSDLSIADATGRDPLRLIADMDSESNSIRFFDLLSPFLSQGMADAQHPETGSTALMRAVEKGFFDFALVLLPFCDASRQDARGRTAFGVALKHVPEAVASYLLNNPLWGFLSLSARDARPEEILSLDPLRIARKAPQSLLAAIEAAQIAQAMAAATASHGLEEKRPLVAGADAPILAGGAQNSAQQAALAAVRRAQRL